MRRLEFEAEPKIPIHRSYKKQCLIQTRAHPFTIVAQMAYYVCQERYNTVISKPGKETVRIGRFLKPCAKSSADAERFSSRTHVLFEEMFSRKQRWPNKVNFLGWAYPQRKWEKWVEKLKVEHSVMWKQIGIYNAIMSSCCEIWRVKEIVLGLVEFWCSEMNTFVFPWGEATITLEDVMILGGVSVLGEPTRKAVIAGDLKMVVEVMSKRRTAMAKGKSKKASHGAWMNHFMENANDSEVEHVAFLSLWLSRYVFPVLARETISKEAFPIAARLAGGTQMALAPAILAGLYKNLSLLKEKALAFSSDELELTVFAPFQLVLLWAFEHFPHLVQKPPHVLKPGEPRAARWSKLSCKMDKSVVDTIFLSGQCFQWRPYAADISNWNHSSYYKVEERLEVDSEKNSDEDLQSYLICITMSYLDGLDCRVRYMPHRVAMQFGMDQDLPGEFSGLNVGPKKVCFFVPPRSFEPGVSLKYFKWWRSSEFMCGGKLPNASRISLDTFQMPPGETKMSSKDHDTPSVATRLKNSETVAWSSVKSEVKDILDDEQEFGKRSDKFDVLFKPVCESDFMCGAILPNGLRRSLDTFQMPPGEAELSSKDHHTTSVATRLKNSKTVTWPVVKPEVIDILDDEQEFGKRSDKFNVLFKPVCESDFMCGAKLPNGLRRSLDTFQMPPGEAELSSKDHHTPSVATRLKNSKTVAWPVVKSEVIDILDDEQEFGKRSDEFDVLFKPVCESDFPTKQGGSLKRSPSIEELKGDGGFCTPAKSFGLGSLECSNPSSVPNNFSPTQRFQDSVEADLTAVAGTSKQMADEDSKEIDDSPPSDGRRRANGLSSRTTADEVDLKETIRKRKLSTSTDESTHCKDTISMINANTDELQEECVKEAMEVDERDFELQKLDLEKRIEKLEKLMGIYPD